MTTLIERATRVVRNCLHRPWHARELGIAPYAFPDGGVRMVMSDLGMAASDIWRTAAHQRAVESLDPWRNAVANPSAYTALARLRGRCQRVLRNRGSTAELAACPPSELRRIAQDVGLIQTDLRSLRCSHAGPTQLMPWRLQQLGSIPRM
jgi:hypothetical protein